MLKIEKKYDIYNIMLKQIANEVWKNVLMKWEKMITKK